MSGRLVFITGASSGIGQALAARYAQAGWRLALVARRTEQTQAWLAELGLDVQRARVYRADVADPDSIIQAAQACINEQGLPDVVIASAGISVGMDSAEREDLRVMQDTFATNNVGLAATFHPFLRLMRQRQSGTLVGIASVAAIRGLPGHGAYCESLRGECLRQNVKVVTLLPGYIATPLTAQNPYSMPFLMPVAAFAERAFQAIEAGSSYRVIPWQMGVLAKVMRLLPNAIFDRLVGSRGRKPRRA